MAANSPLGPRFARENAPDSGRRSAVTRRQPRRELGGRAGSRTQPALLSRATLDISQPVHRTPRDRKWLSGQDSNLHISWLTARRFASLATREQLGGSGENRTPAFPG